VVFSLFPLDPDADTPLYVQLRDGLKDAIHAGRFPPGRALPSSRQLADDLGVSRNTVNAAYHDLEAEGFLDAEPRRGYFVDREAHETLVAQPPPPLLGRFDWERRLGDHPTARLTHIDKTPSWPAYPYHFLAGQPDLSVFPVRAWVRALRDASQPEHLSASLMDAQASDDPRLLEAICEHVLPSRGIQARAENVLVTLGSQSALDLVARTLVGAGTTVAFEEPGYVDARNILHLAGATVQPVRVDPSGLCVTDALPRTDLVYVTPSHQYPTNVTLSIGRRRRLLALAAERGSIILEDDYDSEFRYRGSPTVALKALDDREQVVYMGSFSKLLAPGLRLGYVVGAPELISQLRLRARYAYRHPPGILQRALALFIANGQFGRHVRRLRTHYRQKWELITAVVADRFTWREHDFPPGGMSVWVTGPDGLDATDLASTLAPQGVLIEPGRVCYASADAPTNRFKLGFAAIPAERIAPGVQLIARAIERAC